MFDPLTPSLEQRLLRIAAEDLLELDALRPESSEGPLVVATLAACAGPQSNEAILVALAGHLVERTLLWQVAEVEEGRSPRPGSPSLRAVIDALGSACSICEPLAALEAQSRASARPLLDVLTSDPLAWSEPITALGVDAEVLRFVRERTRRRPVAAAAPSAPRTRRTAKSGPRPRNAHPSRSFVPGPAFRVQLRTATRLGAEPQGIGDRLVFQISGLAPGVDPERVRPVVLRQIGDDAALLLPDPSGRWPRLSEFSSSDDGFDVPLRLGPPAGLQRFVVGVLPETMVGDFEAIPGGGHDVLRSALRAGDLSAQGFAVSVAPARPGPGIRRAPAPSVALLRVLDEAEGGWRLTLGNPGGRSSEALVPLGVAREAAGPREILDAAGDLWSLLHRLREAPRTRELILAVQTDSTAATDLPWEQLEHPYDDERGTAALTVVRLDPAGRAGPLIGGRLQVTAWIPTDATDEVLRRVQGLGQACRAARLPEPGVLRGVEPGTESGVLWVFLQHEDEVAGLRALLVPGCDGDELSGPVIAGPAVLVLDPPADWDVGPSRLMDLLAPALAAGVEVCIAATRGADEEAQSRFRHALLEELASGTPLALAVRAARNGDEGSPCPPDRPVLASSADGVIGRFIAV